MSKETPPLFGKTKFLEEQIDEFLDKIAEGAIYFERGMKVMIDEGASEVCEEKLQQIVELKERCSELRRSVTTTLYAEMLIPDFRGNVLSLLTDLYALLDVMMNSFQEFMLEYGSSDSEIEIESILKADAKELIAVVIKSVQTVVIAARAFFRNPAAVRDHIHEVRVYESEADKIALRLKKELFQTDIPLERKILARDSIDIVDGIADMAEDISDELSIYAIKRAL